VEGPAARGATILAVGGSITYRPNRMTSEGQTAVACADVETLECALAGDAVPEQLNAASCRRGGASEQPGGDEGSSAVAANADWVAGGFKGREEGGGADEFVTLDRVEAADRAASAGGVWVQEHALREARDGLAAAVCDDRLYVSGGMDERDMDLDLVESCGPDRVWRRESFVTPVPVSFHASVCLEGRLYVLGGLGVERVMDQQCWRRNVYSLDLAAPAAAGAFRGGAVTDQDAAARWDGARVWTPHAPMLSKRAYFGAVTLHGRIYVMGGRSAQSEEADYTKGIPGLMWDKDHVVLNTVESYDPREGVWRFEPSMQAVAAYRTSNHRRIIARGLQQAPGARCCFGAAALGDRIFAIGGCDGEIVLDTVESWDVRSTSGWRLEPPLRRARANLAACAVHARVYAIGGWDGSQDLHSVESFALGEPRWRPEADLEIPRSNLAAAVLWR
jgi:hypothetical protein